MPTPANFLASWRADRCDVVFCIPVFIEAWARDPNNLDALKALDCIVRIIHTRRQYVAMFFVTDSLFRGFIGFLWRLGEQAHWGQARRGRRRHASILGMVRLFLYAVFSSV